jgi:ectoine hydroxylase-related dioxygenase (phytanoyl-CoA dioxygenase family)
MHSKILSAEEIFNFRNKGFLLKPKVLSSSFIYEIKSASEQFDSFKTSSFLSLMNPHKTHDTFMLAAANPDIISMLSQLFEGPVSLVQSQFFYGPPGRTGYSNHQDNFFLQTDPRYFVSVWLSLSFSDKENGGLIMYPGSQVLPILEVQDISSERRGNGQDPNSDRVEVVWPSTQKFESVDVTTAPGDLVFIHANVVHASYPNISKDRYRASLLCTYIKTGTPFRSGNYAKREELPL